MAYTIQSYGLRPSTSTMITDPVVLLKIFVGIAIAAVFLYWVVVEVFEYYPTGKRVEESFQSSQATSLQPAIPVIYRPEPRAINSTKLNSESDGGVDMDVLRSNKLYKVGKKGETEPEVVKTAVWTLQWEVPTTYMLDLISRVRQSFQTDPLQIPQSHMHTNIPTWLGAYQPDSPTFNPQNPVYTYDRLAKLTPDQLLQPELAPFHELIHLVKLHLMTRINLEYLAAGYALEVHKFQPFAVVKSQWLRTKVIRSEPLAMEFTVNIIIHRPLKIHTFNIQFQFTAELGPRINPLTNSQYKATAAENPIRIQMDTLEVLGSSIQGEKLIGTQPPGLSSAVKNNPGSPISDMENTVIPGVDIALTDNATNTINVPGQITAFLSEHENTGPKPEGKPVLQNTRSGQIDPVAQTVNKYNLLSMSSPYKCFAVNPAGQSVELAEIVNPLECQSYLPGINSVGVWDKPCTEDTECPFYGKNGNYTNTLGGCDKLSGKCQMPIGVARIGYKHYSKKTEPECHNCPASYVDDKCCKSQAADPKLRGPDLKYMDDEVLRQAVPAIDQLARLGLKP